MSKHPVTPEGPTPKRYSLPATTADLAAGQGVEWCVECGLIQLKVRDNYPVCQACATRLTP